MTPRKLQFGLRSQAILFGDGDEAVSPRPALAPATSLSPEQRFCESIGTDHRRRFAQFFTPPPVAQLMVEMLDPQPGARLLDPACGPGVLIEQVALKQPDARITAIDIDATALDCMAASTIRSSVGVPLLVDFLSWDSDATFDGVIANPPYLKYQQFDCAPEVYARLSAVAGEPVSKFSNLYLLFLLEAYRRLVPGGRAVFIVPGEWANANFGEPFKRFLAREGCLRALIYFSHSQEMFDDAMTTASIVDLRKPATGQRGSESFRSLYVHDAASIDSVRDALRSGLSNDQVGAATFQAQHMAQEKKWDFLLRHPDALHASTSGWRALGDWCSSRRGIATGANDYFHLRPSRAEGLGLQSTNLLPCVGGARHVRGAAFDATDYDALHAADQPCLLWTLKQAPSATELDYVGVGETRGLPQRYLLSKRRPWYSMERANPAPIWVGVFGRGGLRVIRNRSGVAQLTTYHGLTPRNSDPLLADALVVALHSTIAVKAIERARRVFGAGLEKVEPADLLDIHLPDLPRASKAALARVASCLPPLDANRRAGGASNAALQAQIDSALDALVANLTEQDTHQALALQA